MPGKIFEVTAQDQCTPYVTEAARRDGVVDVQIGPLMEDGRRTIRVVVGDRDRQDILDRLQMAVAETDNWRIALLPVEAVLPAAEPPAPGPEKKRLTVGSSGVTREELQQTVTEAAHLDGNFLILTFLSTVVAAIGLITDNVAVVIGAMVIAPFLGPNLALSFATSIGDADLFWRAARTNFIGIGLCLVLAVGVGLILPVDLHSVQVMGRTGVTLGGVVLALASGAAAALSLTSGLSSTMVGVMVAVALLPPTATLGLMLGGGHWPLAAGAAMLLAVNVVCVNLSAQLLFFTQGIRPRAWFEKQRALRATRLTVIVWTALLAILVALILLKRG
jgi:uncharacterized hydrophobic protein (TIGR00341 family)